MGGGKVGAESQKASATDMEASPVAERLLALMEKGEEEEAEEEEEEGEEAEEEEGSALLKSKDPTS